MKKILLLVSAAAFVLTACNGNAATGADTEETTTARVVSNQIAYVNLDSLLTKYDMFIELSTALQEKATKAENEINSKRRSLERSMADAQEKFEKGLVTRAQGEELQQKLQRQQQNFINHTETVQQELAEENQVMMNNIFYALNKFLEEFNSDYRYGMIISTSGGSPVLHADPQLDITEIVVKALNDDYSKNKSSKED